MRAAAEPVYRLDDVEVAVTTSTGRRELLHGVSFEVAAEEVVAIVGRSGCGKTTLLRVLGGLLPASSGRVELDGKPLGGPPGTVVLVFQDYANALLPWRTVERNVALPLEGRLPKRELRERVAEALELVGLEGRAAELPARLSGGMQQRVQIARAIAVRPRVLLMDEPFGALDAMTKATLQDEILRLQEEIRATIVFVTHDIDEAIYLSDRVLVMAGPPGRIEFDAATELPRPRDQIETRELPRYLELRHRLGEALRGPHVSS